MQIQPTDLPGAETVEKSNIIKLNPSDLERQKTCQSEVLRHNLEFEKTTGLEKKAFIRTFGCQQNEADSEKIAGMCREMGYRISDTPEGADLIVVNTCAIREHAEKKALSVIGQYKHEKEKNRDMIIAVCGCMVSQKHRVDQIKKSYPYIDLVFGTASIHKFPELLWNKMTRNKRLFELDSETYEMAEGIPIERNHPFKAWVSIMYGCNNFCSYCIVPYVRGRERSREPEDILSEVRDLIGKGYREITFLGQNVNSYGRTDHLACDFADLLERAAKLEGDFRLRFMTSHPKDASDKLIDVMARNPKICNQFHLPMQSGSDAILKAMNRHYDMERYMHIVNYIREKIPDCAISSDIIVGFPGETEADFESTLQALKKIRFDMLYAFIYSPRVGTPAASMENQVSDEVKGERFRRLLAVQNEISLELNEAMVGTEPLVLCEGPSPENKAVLSGRTEGNKIVFFEGSPALAGKVFPVHIERADPYALYGKAVL
ncbi:MAG: tRNA (N6-isopentenyl adenosine(37)-C2)-methylthiotransferase MiaB [Clostridia bacterium]|nr:tRNA (N6-isopentenyl adenosine(37)-C2)-methylthiotransferase MiaB [Clostridia bacterium]